MSVEHPATPKDITLRLATDHAVAGTHGARRNMEQRYFEFHKRHGTRLRGKYRPR